MRVSNFAKAAVVVAFGLSGCIQQQTMIWVNPNKDHTAFVADRFECLKVAATATPPAVAVKQDPMFGAYEYDVNEENRDNLFGACMNAKGWVFKPAAPAAALVQQ